MHLERAVIPEGERVYAIGDVHGRFDCLDALFKKIEADLADRPINDFKIIMLGDYCDRGPQSYDVLELLSQRRKQPGLSCLLGNHDKWLRDFMEDADLVGEHFLRWGGVQTLLSYGVDAGSGSYREIAGRLSNAMPTHHHNFLNSLEPVQTEGDYLFCHAGIRPGIKISDQLLDDLIWIRDSFLNFDGPHEKIVVHGHTPVEKVDVRNNRINIDTRAYSSGILTCLVLEGATHQFLQTDPCTVRH